MMRIGLFCLSLLIAGLLATCSAGQALQPMVKNQPFPYATGVAMDTALYAQVKAKLMAAEQLRQSSKRAVDSLRKQAVSLQSAIDATTRLGNYDAAKATTLIVLLNQVQTQLADAQNQLRTADLAIGQVLKLLPRRYRKELATARPDEVATTVAEYVVTLRHRKWYWAGGGTLLGFLLTLTLVLRF